VDEVSNKLSMSRGDAMTMVDSVLESIAEGLRKEGKVTISGFGTFVRKRRAARTGVNPATKTLMEIKASATCGFRPSTVLRGRIEWEPAPVGAR
jgi:DNA-binding protein HU-beta